MTENKTSDNGKNKKTPAEVKNGRVDSLFKFIQDALSVPNPDRSVLEKIRAGYLKLDRDEKPPFFKRMLDNVEVRPDDVTSLMEEAIENRDEPEKWRQSLVRLRSGVISPRWRLFRRFVGLPGGLKFLLDLRADVLSAQRQGTLELDPLDHDLVYLFESWFQDGFLFLEEISLDSPLRQIEIIMNGDMVHPMTSLEEMGRRLGRDRRCFALYHRAMPEEPVVFIEVALTKGIVRSIHDIISEVKTTADVDLRPDTAVFYSINNTQNGLAGLGLGQLLIFQVVDFLKAQAPDIRSFCTLSPMPGFWRRYLRPILEGGETSFKMNMEGIEKLFDKKARALLTEEFTGQGGDEKVSLPEMLLSVFSGQHWAENKKLVRVLAKPLTTLGYNYLANEKRRTGRPLDPVANFHLSNGAAISPTNVNFGANWSSMGLERSLSLMVNYVYSLGWRKQISSSMVKIGGLLPGLSRPWTGKKPTVI